MRNRLRDWLRDWLRPTDQAVDVPPEFDTHARRVLWLEITVVLLITFGYSGISAILSLAESAISPGGIGGQAVALNTSRAAQSLIDLGYQLLGIAKLFATAGLAMYLLWRSGIGPRLAGLVRPRLHPQITHGLGLAALIGLPGLGLYVAARALGINSEVVPTTISDHWWRIPALILWAIANAAAEETVVVAYLLTRLASSDGRRTRRCARRHCCAAATTSTKGSAAGSAMSRWGWSSAGTGSAPGASCRSSSRTP